MNSKCKLKVGMTIALLFCACLMSTSESYAQLSHASKTHAVGARFGMGLKSRKLVKPLNPCKSNWDVGLTYNYHFNNKISIICEADYENGEFGKTEFNGFVIAPGAEYAPWNPARWFFLSLSLQACIGYDIWTSKIVDAKYSGIVGGAVGGIGFEFLPWDFLGLQLKAQEYFIVGNDDQYLKPMFSFAIKYNFHK